ncbi:EamA family transporter, partial [Shinella sp.]|uniref:EamA family transporter n=1 Tax=Shinella sp. TaxID=1870904 RepID=UPI003918358E
MGLSVASAGTGTALLKTDVLMVNLISVFFYKMRFSWKQWACTILMLLGVLVVIGINPAELELANWGNIFFLF